MACSSQVGVALVVYQVHSMYMLLRLISYGYQGTSNVTIFPLNSEHKPEEEHARITQIDGRGPHPDRQDHSYCHQVLFCSGYLYVVDLGTDTLNIYRFDDTTGNMSLSGNRIQTAPGAGPRHMLFHPNKPLAFVCNELNSTVNVYRTDRSNGQLELLQTIQTRRDNDGRV
jgi:6-phosphogluconolactonase